MQAGGQRAHLTKTRARGPRELPYAEVRPSFPGPPRRLPPRLTGKARSLAHTYDPSRGHYGVASTRVYIPCEERDKGALSVGPCFGTFIMAFLKVSGTKIVDQNGEEVILRGAGLGGWMKYGFSPFDAPPADADHTTYFAAWRTSSAVDTSITSFLGSLRHICRLPRLRIPDSCRACGRSRQGEV